MKFGFVILHYKTFDVTCDCIDSILALEGGENAFIAIADNHSDNNSAEEIAEKYKDYSNVHVIFRAENDGFSKGNNCGCEFLREHFDPDLIIIANNDVVFYDRLFLKKLEKIYDEERFCVLGTDIINPNTGEHQNPIREKAYTLEEISASIELNRKKSEHISTICAIKSIKNTLVPKKLHSAIKKKIHGSIRRMDYTKRYENVCLFGACHIFSRQFFEKQELPYYPEPRFYYEEDILTYNCERLGMKTVYRPDISIYHMEHVSTRATNKKLEDSLRFKLTNFIESGELYRQLLLNKNI